MLRILVTDDHDLLRDILVAELSKKPDTARAVGVPDADAAISIARQMQPDVVLMDVDMPGASPFEAVRLIQEVSPASRVLFLSGHEYDRHIEQALQCGCQGYVLKKDGLDILLGAIRTVVAGGMFFSDSIRKRLIFDGDRPTLAQARSAAIRALSRRGRELLVHLGMGASLKEAAACMEVSYKTADNQKASLMRKLGVHDRVQLARLAIREGLVSAA
jgi:DNA-binding NarL/FixJ family response regulator